MKRKISSIIICFLLVFTLLPGIAMADEIALPEQGEIILESEEALPEEAEVTDLLSDEFDTADDLQEVELAEASEDDFDAEYSEVAADSAINATLSPAAAAAYAKKLKAVKSDISTLASIFSGTDVFLVKYF